MKTFLLSLFVACCTISGCQSNSPVQVVNAFGTAHDLASAIPYDVQMSLIGDPHGVKLVFGTTEWPHVVFKARPSWDWSAGEALLMDVTNPGASALSFYVHIDDSISAAGGEHFLNCAASIPPGKTETFAIKLAAPVKNTFGMRALPPMAYQYVAMATGSASPVNMSHVVAYQIFLHQPSSPTTLILDNVRLAPGLASRTKGIVDQFGQYTAQDWPGKLHDAAELKADIATEATDLKLHPAMSGRDRFGGWALGPKIDATGFFHTAKYKDKWTLVDPDGHLFFSLGMDCVGIDEPTVISGRETMFSWLPNDHDPLHQFLSTTYETVPNTTWVLTHMTGDAMTFYDANLWRKFGAAYQKRRNAEALARLSSWGFNTVGNWSDKGLYGNGAVPYVATLNSTGHHATIPTGKFWGIGDPYDPQFAKVVESNIGPTADKLRSDPWCLGYFVDNEMPWGYVKVPTTRFAIAYGALSLEASSCPAKQAFLAKLHLKYVQIEALNTAWQTHYATWDAMNSSLTLPDDPPPGMRSDLSAFLFDEARQYFNIVRDTIHRHDPNHLYLGCRFASSTPECVAASQAVCDVTSFNIYNTGIASDFLKTADRPCIVGEFSFGALDRGMFSGGLVPEANENGRAQAFASFVVSVLDNPVFVGCHWFQYIDDPLTGRALDGENMNMGFVSVADRPYGELVGRARQTASVMYERRFGGK